jgi:spore coat-associated protein N
MSIKKKLGLALGGTALAATLIGGGTFALFTDNVSNANNTFATGNFSITNNDSTTVTVTDVLNGVMAPGDSVEKTYTIQNDGDYDAWVKINPDASISTGDLFGGTTPISVTLDEDVEYIPAGGTKTFTVKYQLPLTAGNSYQNKTGSYTVNFQAVQYKNNGDANGNRVLDDGETVDWN